MSTVHSESGSESGSLSGQGTGESRDRRAGGEKKGGRKENGYMGNVEIKIYSESLHPFTL